MEKKEKLLFGILGAIALIWLAVGILQWRYVYWPAVAGALSIPFLLAALFMDNLPFPEHPVPPHGARPPHHPSPDAQPPEHHHHPPPAEPPAKPPAEKK